MRKLILLSLLGLVVVNADPFITVSGYTMPVKMGMFGPSVSVSVPDPKIDASLWFSYGIIPRMDITFMLNGEYQDYGPSTSNFHLHYLMAEARYDVVGKERFALSPVLDIFMPLDVVRDSNGLVLREPIALGPGIMTTAVFNRLSVHGNILTYIPLDYAFCDICLFVAPEYGLSSSFSAYVEAGCVFSIDNDNSEINSSFEFWPGVSWMPLHWLSISSACGIPTSLDYLIPSISAYVFF